MNHHAGNSLSLLILISLTVLNPVTHCVAEIKTALQARPVEPRFEDLPELRNTRLLRVLVSYSQTNYFIDQGRQRGFEYEMINRFADHLNEGIQREDQKVVIVFIPVSFDQLIPMLIEGRGEIGAASLTITEDRRRQVDFTDPFLQNVNEILVSSSSAPEISSLNDLSGKTIYVAESSSYKTHLTQLNRSRKAKGFAPIKISSLGPQFKTEDYLDLANSGVIDYTVADDYLASIWTNTLSKIKLHPNIIVNRGSRIAWAVRKNAPLLRKELNRFVQETRKGTLYGNIFYNRYLKNSQWIANPLIVPKNSDLEAYVPYFHKYADMYGFDWLKLAAQGFQESQLKQNTRSAAGAVGIMQLLPSTAADMNLNPYDPEQNIHAGAQYMAGIMKQLHLNPNMDSAVKFDFALASYNAGPARVQQWRKKAATQGIDPDRWFNHVEYIAYRETVRYVGNVNKYYIAYRLSLDSKMDKDATKALLIGN